MILDVLIETKITKDMDEKKVEHMSAEQAKTARGIIKDHCCNYDSTTGGCLMLDRGEVVPCPQLISQSVICKYFRDVLLEDKRAKDLKAEIYGEDHRKVCAVCGGHFRAISNRAKYCARCSKEMQRTNATNRKRKQRGYVTL